MRRMARPIPTREPTTLRAGDTWTWTRTLADYPADTWTLSYTLFNAAAAITLTATADGTDHLINIAPATTAAYAAGRYDWVARVTDGTDVYTIAKGAIQVQAALGSALDERSHARKMLDAIEATLEGRATQEQLDIVQVRVGDLTTQHGQGELIKLRNTYRHEVAMEDQAARLARGERSGRMVQVRFTA